MSHNRKTHLRILASTATAAILISGAASAADLYEPVAVEEVPYVATPAAFSWTGLYFGVHGGWGWAEGDSEYANEFDAEECDPGGDGFACALSLDPEGAFVGAQVGWQWQWNQLVLGIEADYAAASLNDNGDAGDFPFATHVDLEVDQLASVRGRIGWAIGQWLPFATLGWGWAHAEREIFNPILPGGGGSDDQWHDGWTAGVGLEYAINNHWSVKGEYRFYDLSDENYSVPTLGGDGTDVDLDIHTVQFGINYRF